MYTKSGVNVNTDTIFMSPVPTSLDKKKLEKIGKLYMRINEYTLKRDRLFLSRLTKKRLKNFTHEEEIEHYKDDNFDFRFMLLSDRVDSFPISKKLKTKKRFHKCHEASIGMSLNDDEGNLKILTGYYPCIDREELHSVIEMEEKDITYIVDYTQNLIMEKNAYIKLNNFRVVNEVTSKDLKKDCDIIIELGIRSPFYLAFRDEIMRDLKKNSKVLKIED